MKPITEENMIQRLKLLKLWELLNRKTDKEHPITTMQIIAELTDMGIEVERRTVYSDINALIACGYMIEKKRHNRDMYYWVERRQFDIPELKIMMDAVRSSKFIPEKKTEQLLDKIADLGESSYKKLLRRNTVRFQVVKHSNKEIYKTIENIEGALSKKKRITFLYFDLDINKKRVYRHNRKVYNEQPLSMLCDDGNYYLLCYTDDEDCDTEIKVFRLDRMANVAVSEDDISEEAINTLKSVRQYPKQVFKMYGGKSRNVKLEFDRSLLGVIFNKFGENVRIYEAGDRLIASVRVQISPTFWGWLAQFPGDMRIASPDDIQEMYREWLQKALNELNSDTSDKNVTMEL